MDKVKHINTCSECEHFGNGAFPVVKYYVDGEMKSKFIGFSDRPNGEAIEHFAHKCNINIKTLVYDNSNSEGCKDFTPKTWERPLTCRDCSCYKHLNYQLNTSCKVFSRIYHILPMCHQERQEHYFHLMA